MNVEDLSQIYSLLSTKLLKISLLIHTFAVFLNFNKSVSSSYIDIFQNVFRLKSKLKDFNNNEKSFKHMLQ